MKKILTLLMIIGLAISSQIQAQVSISTTCNDPDASAMLDVQSTDKGLLIPKMTTTQMNNISSPAIGLVVFNTTENEFYYFKAIGWVPIDTDTNTIEWTDGNNGTDDMIYATQAHDSGNEVVILDNGNFGVGLTAPTTKVDIEGSVDASGFVRVGGHSNHLYIAKANAGQDLRVNAGDNIFVVIDDTGNGTGNLYITKDGPVTSGNNALVVVTNSGSMGVGNMTPDASALMDLSSTTMGFLPPRLSDTTSVSSPAEGLQIYDLASHCMRYYNGTKWSDCMGCCTTSSGGSSSNSQTECGSTKTYNEVTNPSTGDTWLDRNLGADQVATASDDYQAYGSLYQWGRLSDDHQCINWTSSTSGTPVQDTTHTLSTTDTPADAKFILHTDGTYDWRNPQNSNLWQGVNGINNPCPSGFRIPTDTELSNERNSWASSDATGAYGSLLKFTVPGQRRWNNGSLDYIGSSGNYWSSTAFDSENAKNLYITSSSSGISNSGKHTTGFSVRCIKD